MSEELGKVIQEEVSVDEEVAKNIVNAGTVDTASQPVDAGHARDFNLPTKVSAWSKFKSFLFKEIKVELTPYQQKVEDEINEFLHQDITWKKVSSFLFKEISFGKKDKVEN